MGGNALPEGLTERKPLAQYLDIKALVLATLKQTDISTSTGVNGPSGGNTITDPSKVFEIVSEIVEMPEKESFGDLDLLYVPVEGVTASDIDACVQQLFSPTAIVKSGDVTSFDFMKFQIDLIRCTRMTFGMSRFCLSYGDRGMILGQMAKCRGFSLGTKGLVVKHSIVEELLGYTADNVHISSKDQIVLTTDPVEVRAFMGLSEAVDELGGDDLSTQENVISFCLQSPWFKPQYFAPRKLNNCESRKKLSKRPFYNMFCSRIAEDYDLANIPKLTDEEIAAQKEAQLMHVRDALEYFDKTEELERIRHSQAREQEVRSKLSHTLFLGLGVDKRSIGAARSSFTQWLLQHHSALLDNDSIFRISDEAAQQTVILRRSIEQLEKDMQMWFEEEWSTKC